MTSNNIHPRTDPNEFANATKEPTVSTDDPSEPITDESIAYAPEPPSAEVLLLTGILQAVNEQNAMLAEALTVLSAAGEKVEGMFGGKEGKPSGFGALGKILLG